MSLSINSHYIEFKYRFATKSSLDDVFQEITAATSLENAHGMRFYATPYNFCVDYLKRRMRDMSELEFTPVPTDLDLSGNWIIFGKLGMLREAIHYLHEVFSVKELQGLVKVRLVVKADSEAILLLKCHSIFDTEQIRRCYDLVQQILEPIFRDHGVRSLTWFFKPEVLSKLGITKDSDMKSYIFKKRMRLL